jgi:hypothetical protein
MGFVSSVTGGKPVPNVLEADFTKLPGLVSIEEAMAIDDQQRDPVETLEARRLAAELIERLPRSDERMAELINTGAELAAQMSWENVVTRFLMPALERTEQLSDLGACPT